MKFASAVVLKRPEVWRVQTRETHQRPFPCTCKNIGLWSCHGRVYDLIADNYIETWQKYHQMHPLLDPSPKGKISYSSFAKTWKTNLGKDQENFSLVKWKVKWRWQNQIKSYLLPLVHFQFLLVSCQLALSEERLPPL